MTQYCSDPSRFPAAVMPAVLAPGTALGGFTVREVLSVTESELCYRAECSGKDCLLTELLPFRYCRCTEDGTFVPFHEEAAERFAKCRAALKAKLTALRPLSEEAAVALPLAVFEAMGTLFAVSLLTQGQPVSAECKTRTYKAREAVHLLAPVLDTLAGLHAAGLCHGAVSADTVLLSPEGAQLRGFLTLPPMGEPTVHDDVRGIALVLWQMLTGTVHYDESAAAALSPQVRAAICNALNDPQTDLSRFWRELHAKRAAKRMMPELLRSARPSRLGKLLSPALTAAFCGVCVAAPLLIWSYEVGALTNEPDEVLSDVAYSLADGEIQLPELLYKPQDEAVKMLEDLGLTVILAPREDNPVVPEDQVVLQKPTAGAVVHAGDTVTLTVSDGWANYVPDLAGTKLEDAKARLEELGFLVNTVEKISPDDAPGIVIAQSAAPDSRLERGKTVVLTVSLGREDLDVTKLETVGDYVGMQFDDAKAELADLHLYAVQIETVYDADTLAGTILSQDIMPGKNVPQGTSVSMVVSKGVETSRVPDLLHLSAASAKASLEAAKLRCVICYVPNTEWAIDTVLSQSAGANSLVAVGTEIWLTVSVGSGSWVESTGGWTGGPIPSFENTEETEDTSETDEETYLEPEDTAPAAETDAPSVPETSAPETEAPATEEPPQELTAPPMPE